MKRSCSLARLKPKASNLREPDSSQGVPSAKLKVLLEFVEGPEADPAVTCACLHRAIRVHSDWPALILALVDKLSLPVSGHPGLSPVPAIPVVRFSKTIEHDEFALFSAFRNSTVQKLSA